MENVAKGVGPNKINVAYEDRGDKSAPPVVLIMAVAAQMIHWPEGLLTSLESRGLRLIRFDNRDAGLSSHMTEAPAPDFMGAMKGDFSSVSYTLSDMAADTVGLMDYLGIDSAHIVGASMGGAIAQTVAIEHPDRVVSLTSMMASTGNLAVGQVHPETMKLVFGGPPAKTRDDVIARAKRTYETVGSPLYPANEEDVMRVAGLAWDRDHDETSVVRQAIATLASGDRTEKLKQVAIPTLVIHGLADTMCDPSGGKATAVAVPGAKLVEIEGMGHNLPPGLWAKLTDLISEFVVGKKK